MHTAKKKMGRPASKILKEQRTDEILETAIELFAERGFAEADTHELAKRLNVGKGTIYRYFPTKEAIFLAAADRVMDGLMTTVTAAMDRCADPLEQVAAAIGAYLTYFSRHTDYVELLVQERAYFKDRKKPTYFEHRDKNMGRWMDLLTELAASGRVRQLPVDQLSDIISNLVYGTMFTNQFAGRRQSIKKQVDNILDILLNGILVK